MKLSLSRLAARLKNLLASPSRPRRPRQARLGILSLEDRVVPSVTSPDTRHTADVVHDAVGSPYFHVVEDGKAVSPSYIDVRLGLGFNSGPFTQLGFSPDSQHLVWLAKSASGGWGVFEDGQPLGPTNFWDAREVGFSGDSRHYAFVGRVAGGGGVVWEEAFVDGRTDGQQYTGIGNVHYSTDSRFLTYTVPTAFGPEQHNIPLALGATVAGTATTLTGAAGTSVYGQAVTFTATVRAASGVADGSVTFLADGRALQTVGLNAAGQASVVLSALNGGPHAIVAAYSGGAGLASSRSAALAQTVNRAGTTTAVGSSALTSVHGQAVTFTATVTGAAGGVPGGLVTFFVDGQAQPPVDLNTSGQASLTLSSLAAGPHTVTAAYAGNSNFLPSQTAVPLTHTVNPAGTVTAVGSSALTSVYGQAVTFTATVRAAAPGSGVPGGLVTFFVDGKAQPPVVLNVLAQAGLTLSTLAAGPHTVTAAYGGIADFLPSQTTPLSHGVYLSLSPAALAGAVAGQSYRATISAAGGSGSYSYSVVSGSLPDGLSLAGGILSGTVKRAGTYSFGLKAVDTAHPSIIGTQVCTLRVAAGAPAVVVVSAPAAVLAGLGFPVTISAKDQYNNGCTGPVTLTSSDGQAVGVLPASVTLNHGVASILVALRTAGAVTLSATAGGVSGRSGTVTVNPAAPSSFVVSAPAAAVAGKSFNLTVTAHDAFGNVTTNVSGLVGLLSSDSQAVTPHGVYLTRGVGTAAVTLNRAGTVTLTAGLDAARKGTSAAITVSPAAAASFTVTAPAAAVAGKSFNLTVTAHDAFGNVATGYNGTVNLTSSDGQAVTPASVTLVNGTATVTVTLNVPRTVRLTASGAATGFSDLLTVLR